MSVVLSAYIKRALVCAVIFVTAAFVWSEESLYHEPLKIAPVDAYNAMLKNVQTGTFDRIETALQYIQPVFGVIQKQYRLNLKEKILESIRNKDKDQLKKDILLVMYFDMKYIFSEIERNGNSVEKNQLRAFCKMAYSTYIVISPEIVSEGGKKGFEADREIKKQFRKLYRFLNPSSPYRDVEGKLDMTVFRQMADEIEKTCEKTVPVFRITVKIETKKEKKESAEADPEKAEEEKALPGETPDKTDEQNPEQKESIESTDEAKEAESGEEKQSETGKAEHDDTADEPEN